MKISIRNKFVSLGYNCIPSQLKGGGGWMCTVGSPSPGVCFKTANWRREYSLN